MKNRALFGLALVLVTVLLIPAGGQAAYQQNHFPSQSHYLDIMSGDGLDNVLPSLAYNTQDDEYLAAWVTKINASTWSLWGRRVHAGGSLEPAFEILNLKGGLTEDPALAYNPDRDEYLLAFTFSEPGGASGDYEILGLILQADGSSTGAVIPISESPDLDEKHAAVAYSPALGSYLLVYDQETDAASRQIMGRAVPGDYKPGAVESLPDPAFPIATGGESEDRYAPDVAFQPEDGNFMVVYACGGSLPSSVRGRRVPADLSPGGISQEYDIGAVAGGGAAPSIAAGAGEYLVAYSTQISASASIVLGRRLALSGEPQGSPGDLILSDPQGNGLWRLPDGAALAGGGYRVVMETGQPASSNPGDIYAQELPFGADLPGELLPLDTSPNLQSTPAVACGEGGVCLAVYEHTPRLVPGVSVDIRGAFLQPFAGQSSTFLPLVIRDE